MYLRRWCRTWSRRAVLDEKWVKSWLPVDCLFGRQTILDRPLPEQFYSIAILRILLDLKGIIRDNANTSTAKSVPSPEHPTRVDYIGHSR